MSPANYPSTPVEVTSTEGVISVTAIGVVTSTINNGAGASAVNIQDGGNSITVDGTVASTQSGSWAVSANNGAGASAVNIQDGGNSLTVDGLVSASQSGTWTVQPGNTANTTPWLTSGTVAPATGTLTDGSGACSAAPNTFKQVFAANASRKYLFIQNVDQSGGLLYLQFGSDTNVLHAITINSYGSFVMESGFISTATVNVASSVGSTDYCAKEGT